MKKNYNTKYNYFRLFFILLLIINQNGLAQCAGLDNTITICDKELDATLQNFNLFNQLNGNPTSGGIWTSDSRINNNELNESTGILNLWGITRNGTHSFTYSNSDCNETATVTINLGGYPGEDNLLGGANACSDDEDVNLYTFLDNELENLNADINGTWLGIGLANTYLSDNIFNAAEAGTGTYTFTYTVGSVDTCVSEFATVILEVHRAPISGDVLEFFICEKEDLSQVQYTNFDLFDLLVGEDDNGFWEDTNDFNTGQISNDADNFINIEELYNNFGSGEYTFSYTVFPTHGVCDASISEITISIPSLIGQFRVNNICNSDIIDINLFYINNFQIEFSHFLVYEIRNTLTDELVYTSNNILIEANLVIATEEDTEDSIEYDYNTNAFSIDTSIITNPGPYTVSAKSITNISGIICDSLEISSANFTVFKPDISIASENNCVEKNEVINLTITNHTGIDGILINTTQSLEYNVTYGTETIVINNDITFVNGEAALPINLSLFSFPEGINEANIDLSFNNTEINSLSCINDITFPLRFPPSKIKLSIDVDNQCDATKVEAEVEAPTLPNGEYNITYEVTEIGNTEILLTGNRIISGGFITDDLNIGTLEKGNYQVTLKSVQNDTTPCRTEFEFELIEHFSIAGTPDAPILETNQSFCFGDYAPDGPTIADIVVTSGENLTWYKTDDITDTDSLDLGEILENGNYYVSASNPDNDCDDSERTLVTVTIETPSIPTTNNQNPTFCASDSPTLADIEVTPNNGGIIVWYNNNDQELPAETMLQMNTSYFAVNQIGDCKSESLEFSINMISPPIPVFEGETQLCPLLNTTIRNLEETEIENEIITLINFDATVYELIWYDAEEGGSELSTSEPLVENETYYAVLREIETGCESKRLAISITFTICEANEYNFFIPDGFSPNNDGSNDTYFIPNIEYFYPNYTFEIFNRYGQSLFKGDINTPAWDGTSNGSATETTSGVYFYILNYNNNDLKPSQGRIYLSK